VDYSTGQWTIDAVYPNVGVGKRAEWNESPRVIYHGDTLYLAFGRNQMIYRLDGDRFLASAGIISERVGDKRNCYFWHDAAGDGQVREADYRACPTDPPPGTLRYFGETWADDLSLLAMGQGTKDLWRLPPARFDAHGNPVYEKWEKLLTDPIFAARAAGTADAVHGGNECADDFNSDWSMINGTPGGDIYVNARGGFSFSANFGAQIKISRYVPDGQGGYRIKWRVGRQALQGTAKPGEMYGTIFLQPPTNGLLSVVDQSRAGVVLYTEEGMYVDTLFPDSRVLGPGRGGLYPQPGEFFQGYHYLNRDNGKIYIAFGKTQPILFELQGWSAHENPVKKIAVMQASVAITAAQVATPPEIALFVRGGAGTARIARFAPAPGGGPALDGSMIGWESAEPVKFQADAKQTVEARVMYDPANLYIRWHARLGRAPATPDLAPAEHLFSHERGADILSLYLQGDPTAAPGSSGGVGRPGDLRLVFGLFRDAGAVRPVVLGMYPKWYGAGPAHPILYNTPATKAPFENVALVDVARVGDAMDADGQGFVIAAAIPRAALAPLPPFSGELRTMVNFDANFGGHNRFWWSNADGSASRETFDEPSEARFYPGSWAPALFAGLGERLVVPNWLLCGPFGGPGAEKFREDLMGLMPGTNEDYKQAGREFAEKAQYPPDNLQPDLTAVYQGPVVQGYWGNPGAVRWHQVRIADLDTRVVCGPSVETWYGATWIFAPADTPLNFIIQGHPQTYLSFFLNGQKFFEGACSEKSDPPATECRVTLKQGWNQVFFRGYCVGYPPFRVGLIVSAPQETLWTLRLSPTPPG
jgi:hypothetical protein